jgi:predicted metal-dependent hydrolase
MMARGTPSGWDEGVGAPVTIRISRRARRIALRVMTAERGVELVLPRGVPKKLGLNFLAAKRDWIAARLDALPRPVPFAEGAIIPVLGVPHRICRVGVPARGWARDPAAVAIGGGEIRVRGEGAEIARAVRAYLMALARSEFARRAQSCAARIGCRAARIGVRDTRSRWGSCSAGGNLSFCWRLVLAPESVLDYVVAHEVAHLVEMNHGPRFWRLVHDLCPDSAAARAWLKRHRTELLSYGAAVAGE